MLFMMNGYVCEIVDMGEWLCGYVGVASDHLLYGVEYDYTDLDFDITYSGFREGSAWYFGIDTDHYYNEVNGTTLDVEALKEELLQLTIALNNESV